MKNNPNDTQSMKNRKTGFVAPMPEDQKFIIDPDEAFREIIQNYCDFEPIKFDGENLVNNFFEDIEGE